MTVRVKRIAPIGLIVDLGDGREGLIREREIAWEAEARQGWRERYTPGNLLQVVALKVENGSRPEFSLRLAQADPWQEVRTRYPVGALVEGVVTGVMPYGVFVELEPGVTGLLHVSRFPTWATGQPETIFWPSDYVKVTIGSINAVERRIELSMTDLSRRRWEASEDTSAVSSGRRRALSPKPAEHHSLPMQSLALYGAKLILVVDDDERIREDMAGWLRNAGHAVLLARDSTTALQVVADSVPEVAVIDIGLPGLSGIQLMHRLRAEWPELRGILMTGHYEAHENDTELTALIDAGVALLHKPFRPDELLTCLDDGLLEEQTRVDRKFAKGRSATSSIRKDVTSPLTEHLWLTKTLMHLRSATHADLVALFLLDPVSRKVQLIEQVGQSTLKTGVLPSLIHSPVRDVAEDGLTMRALDVQQATGPRFRHLFSLISFGSCLGLPVSAELNERHALFLFFRQSAPAGITKIVEAHARATAASVAAWLERRQFTAQFAGLQSMLLLGQISRSLIHEINNQRQNLPTAISMLQARHQAIAQCAQRDDTSHLAWEIDRAETLLQKLSQELDRLVGVTDPLMLMIRQEQREFLLLDQMLSAAVDVVRDAAQRVNVILTMRHVTPFCYIRLPAATVVQILVNILLNAIQQIERVRGRSGGQVVIDLALTEDIGQSLYRIRVEDDGPGIHLRMWERIFEMGYTTRPEGTGLGLFISRNLIEGLGGRVFVIESAVGWGSTFVVEMPQQS